MTGRHYRWHVAWSLYQAARTATHSSGLVVELGPPPAVQGGPPAVAAWLATQPALRDPASQASRLLQEAARLRPAHQARA